MAREISQLHPRLQAAVGQLKRQFPEMGIGECFRSVSEQEELYAQGRTKPGKKVTNARGTSYSSQHQWGIAFDFYKNVRGQEYSDTAWFRKVARYAKSIGLGWGGDWTSIVDMPHLYLTDWGSTTAKLKQQYGTPDRFAGTWEPVTIAKEVVLSDTYADESHWYLEDAGDGYVFFRNKKTGLYLEVSSADNGTFFQVCTKTGVDSQKFRIVYKNYDYAQYMLIEPKSACGKYASVEGNGVSGTGKTHLKLWEDMHNSQQKFWSKVAADGSYLFMHVYSIMYISVNV